MRRSRDPIKVRVESGWITLGGSVSRDFQRRDAETALRSLKGVRGLTNGIQFDH